MYHLLSTQNIPSCLKCDEPSAHRQKMNKTDQLWNKFSAKNIFKQTVSASCSSTHCQELSTIMTMAWLSFVLLTCWMHNPNISSQTTLLHISAFSGYTIYALKTDRLLSVLCWCTKKKGKLGLAVSSLTVAEMQGGRLEVAARSMYWGVTAIQGLLKSVGLITQGTMRKTINCKRYLMSK